MQACVMLFNLILAIIGATQAVKCYLCTGHTDDGKCGDPFNNKSRSFEYDCGSSVEGCSKANVGDIGMCTKMHHSISQLE